MLQGEQDAEHSTSKQVVIEITDKGDDMLVRTNSMSTFPGIICCL